LPDIASAATGNTDFVSEVFDKYQTQTKEMTQVLKTSVTYWFGIAAALEICLIGVRAILGKSGDLGEAMKELCMTIFIICFFWVCFQKYEVWTNDLREIFKELAKRATGTEQVATDAPFLEGLRIVQIMLIQMKQFAVTDVANRLGFMIAAGIVMFIFALISAHVLLIKCEAVIAMSGAIVLLPLGACGILRSYAQNVLKYILAVMFKLFVMELVIGVGTRFITNFSHAGVTRGINEYGAYTITVSSVQFQELLPIIGASVILLALVNTLPETAAGIVNGGTVGGGSGAGIGAAASAIGGAVGAAVGTAISGPMKAISQAMSGIGAVNAASKLANDAGKTGFGKLGHMAGSLYQASKDFDRQHNPEKAEAMNRSLQEQYKMAQKPPASQNKGENS
jgi:type IV secretion system protein TrbL